MRGESTGGRLDGTVSSPGVLVVVFACSQDFPYVLK